MYKAEIAVNRIRIWLGDRPGFTECGALRLFVGRIEYERALELITEV